MCRRLCCLSVRAVWNEAIIAATHEQLELFIPEPLVIKRWLLLHFCTHYFCQHCRPMTYIRALWIEYCNNKECMLLYSQPCIFLPTQNLLGTHNLGRVHYEPIKDRHGNVLLVTVREMDSSYSFFNGKWMQVSKLQSQRKSLSTPEEPYALDILLITIQVQINSVQ